MQVACRNYSLTNLRRSSSLRRCFSGMDRHRLRARAATVPAPICRACACRRVMVSWMVLALASGRICCLREHCAGLAECGGGTQLLRSDSAGSCCAAIGPQPAQLDLRAWLLVADARGCVLGVVICVALASTRTLLACLGSSCTYRHWFYDMRVLIGL